MLADSLTITYNAVAVTLNKVTEANFSSQYYGEATGMRFNLSVKHTIPPVGKGDESHLIKLQVEHFDPATGTYIRSVAPWVVIKTLDNSQDTTQAFRATKALIGLMSDAFVNQIIGRQS